MINSKLIHFIDCTVNSLGTSEWADSSLVSVVQESERLKDCPTVGKTDGCANR